MDRTLSDATIPGQSGPGSNGNERVHHIPQSSIITGASPLFSVISKTLIGVVLPYCRDAVCVFYRPPPTGYPGLLEVFLVILAVF